MPSPLAVFLQTAWLMRQFALFILCLLVGTLMPLAGNAQYHLMTPDAVLPYVKNTILKAHASLRPTSSVKQAAAGQHMVQLDPLPVVQSAAFGSAIIASQAAYDQGQFAQAAAQLNLAIASEAQNPFLLFHYARALYPSEADKPQSFVVYQQLVRNLDQDNGENDSTATIDYWFLEAYWKLGTLQMDQAQWGPAAYNIARFLIGAASLNDLTQEPLLYEQALGYLTECYFRLDEPEICRYYGNRTLKFFPQNQYVKAYFARLPPSKATTKRLRP